MFAQKLKFPVSTPLEIAEKYYGVIAILNNIALKPKELKLLAFAALHGKIRSAPLREEFCKLAKTTMPTINNMISSLKRKKLFLKQGKRIYVNPAIQIPRDEAIILQIYIVPHIPKPRQNEYEKARVVS